MTWVHWVIFVGSVVLGMIGLWLLWAWLDARNEVHSAPREDMFTCDKHGIFPARYAFQSHLLPLGEPGEGYKVCPVCLADAEGRARTNLGLKKK